MSPTPPERATAAWARAPERSNTAMLRLMAWIAVAGGRTLARLVLVPIALYFLFFSPRQARHSRRFLARAMGREAGWSDGYRHIHTFASTILDRVYLLREGLTRFDVEVRGADALRAAVSSDPGAFLVGGHLGSFEVLHAVGEQVGGMDVKMIMYPDNAHMVNQALAALAPGRAVPIIELGRPASMLAVRDHLDAGGLAGMLGDRALHDAAAADAASISRQVRLPFLGVETDFVDAPMRLAALLRRRVFFMAGVYRGGNRYEVMFHPIADFRGITGVGAGQPREAAIRDGVAAYVAALEVAARSAPYNWFNFHDFWREDEADATRAP
jgi:predicted LPLAT superfamily acyltransferase